jgi:hypothetical protein
VTDRFEPCASARPGQIRRRVKGARNHWNVRVLAVTDGVVACEDVMQWGVGPPRRHPLDRFLALYPDAWVVA